MNRYLFVIDYQNDFVDGALGFPGAEKLDAGIAADQRNDDYGEPVFSRRNIQLRKSNMSRKVTGDKIPKKTLYAEIFMPNR